MYGWIWRHLPFGTAGRTVTTVLLVVGVLTLLWYVVFPAVDPLLPFSDVRVSQ